MKSTLITISIVIACMLFLSGCGGSASDNAKIEEMAKQMKAMQKQLNDVQAVEEIEKLQARYLDYAIYNKLDEVHTLFSENGVLDVFQEKEPARDRVVQAGKALRGRV